MMLSGEDLVSDASDTRHLHLQGIDMYPKDLAAGARAAQMKTTSG